MVTLASLYNDIRTLIKQNFYDKSETDDLLDEKQDILVSGTNIKTVNNNSLLGSGNISISTSGTVDTALSTTSTNPVENQAITTAINNKANSTHSHGNITSDGKIGNVSDHIITTGENGALQASYWIKMSKVQSDTTILTSFNPRKFAYTQQQYGLDGIFTDNDTLYLEDERVCFDFSLMDNEYLEFTLTVTGDYCIVYYNEGRYYATLNVGSHTFRITPTTVTIDGSSEDNYNTDGEFEFISTRAECGLVFGNKQYNHYATIFDKIYPIGSIYLTTSNLNPSNYMDGEWEQIKDKFLLASGDTYTNGATGGEATHRLTTDEMPSHTHTQNQHRHTETGNYSSGSSGSSSGYTYSSNRSTTTHYTSYATPTINNTGGGQAHNNMPPYLAVYVWKRIG